MIVDDFYYNKNVFVAGGAGMTGQSLIRQLLDRGAFVVATEYQRRKISLQNNNLRIIFADLRDVDLACNIAKDCDIMFMAAARVGGAKSIVNDPASIVEYNLPLQYGLLNAGMKAKIDRVGFISSSYVYPHTGTPNVESEGFQSDPWKPINYGLGWVKRYLETVCKFFHMNSNTKYAIVRPASMYGPYDSFDLESCHAVPALIRKFVDGNNPVEVWGDGNELRCHTYIDDLVSGLLMTTERYAVAEALNICTSEVCSIKDVVDKLKLICGVDRDVIFNKDKPSTIPYKVSSPLLAKELIGWEYKVSVNDGLKKTVEWYSQSPRVKDIEIETWA